MRAIARPGLVTKAPPARGEAGFTFIEVLISLLLVAIAAAAGIALLGATISSTKYAGSSQVAARLAQEVVDMAFAEPSFTDGGMNMGSTNTSTAPNMNGTAPLLSICDPANQPLPPVYASIAAGQIDAGNTAGNMTLFSRRCTVTILGGGLVNTSTAKQLTVTVAWSESGGLAVDGGTGENRPHTYTVTVVRAP